LLQHGLNEVCTSDRVSDANANVCYYSHTCRDLETLSLGTVEFKNYSMGAWPNTFGFSNNSIGGGCGDHEYYIPESPDGNLCIRYNAFDTDSFVNDLVLTYEDTTQWYSSPLTGNEIWKYNYVKDIDDSRYSLQFEIGRWDSGFGNIMFGYLQTENGAVDGIDSTGCCANTSYCVDDSIIANTDGSTGCYASTTLRDTGGGNGEDLEYCYDGTWLLADMNQTACLATGGLWSGDKCCGDDLNESIIVNSYYSWDGTSGNGCCPSLQYCVDDDVNMTCREKGYVKGDFICATNSDDRNAWIKTSGGTFQIKDESDNLLFLVDELGNAWLENAVCSGIANVQGSKFFDVNTTDGNQFRISDNGSLFVNQLLENQTTFSDPAEGCIQIVNSSLNISAIIGNDLELKGHLFDEQEGNLGCS